MIQKSYLNNNSIAHLSSSTFLNRLYYKSIFRCIQSMSETKKESFICDKCGKTYDSESQMNAHKVSVHSVAGGEITMR